MYVKFAYLRLDSHSPSAFHFEPTLKSTTTAFIKSLIFCNSVLESPSFFLDLRKDQWYSSNTAIIGSIHPFLIQKYME